jgi:hypothetical protein
LSAFGYLLALANGEPADPAMFVTAVPDWKIGDTFFAAGVRRRELAVRRRAGRRRFGGAVSWPSDPLLALTQRWCYGFGIGTRQMV